MHIAIAAPSLTGRLNSTFELVSRLENEGHEVTYLCSADIAPKVLKQGFEYVEIPTINFNFKDPNRKELSSWFSKFKFHFKNLSKHYANGKKILHLDEYKRIIVELNPDRVVVDVELHDLIFSAIAAKIPVALFHTWFSDTISINSPSIRTNIIPGQNFSGSKMGILWSWILMRLKINGRVVLNKLTFNNYRRSVFKKYAREIGFDTSGLLVNTLPPLFSFTKLPILTTVMSEFEFPHKFGKNIKYLGPMVYSQRVDKTAESDDEKRLGQILKLKNFEQKKLIYCSVGSLAKGNLSFLKRVVEAVAENNEWVLVMSIGPKMDLESFTDLPPNAHIFKWVPQLKVIEESDCAITHCGINSINECIHFKVPMLLYSGGYTDEDGNAARMAYHGIGIRGNKDLDDSTIIKMNISRILNESSFKDNIANMNDIYKEYCERAITPFL
ncbi:glycosyltransferase [Maribacter sp. 2308TA10-17]|uniref:glycosyltransferase n=1 Tax=Maribacter sp. 2308TA10-17 TaxID=3386276 RepID=UPI0039BD86C0